MKTYLVGWREGGGEKREKKEEKKTGEIFELEIETTFFLYTSRTVNEKRKSTPKKNTNIILTQ